MLEKLEFHSENFRVYTESLFNRGRSALSTVQEWDDRAPFIFCICSNYCNGIVVDSQLSADISAAQQSLLQQLLPSRVFRTLHVYAIVAEGMLRDPSAEVVLFLQLQGAVDVPQHCTWRGEQGGQRSTSCKTSSDVHQCMC